MCNFDRPSVTIPSCPDRCSTTFCGACYYSNITKLTPFVCNNLCNYPPTRRCLYKWSICLRVLSTWVSNMLAMYVCTSQMYKYTVKLGQCVIKVTCLDQPTWKSPNMSFMYKATFLIRLIARGCSKCRSTSLSN